MARPKRGLLSAAVALHFLFCGLGCIRSYASADSEAGAAQLIGRKLRVSRTTDLPEAQPRLLPEFFIDNYKHTPRLIAVAKYDSARPSSGAV